MSEPGSIYEALVLALTLAITAPDEARAKKCAKIADMLAKRLTDAQVADAQAEAAAAAQLFNADPN